MKKILALVLAIAMLATFAACGGAKEAEYKLGMGVDVSLDSSADAADDKDAVAQADATVATVVLDAEGKIVAADLDCAQTKVSVTADGKVTVDGVDLRTKKEKKEDYNMKGVSASYGNIEGGAEWYEQAAAFVEKMVGKTVADIKALTTEEKNGHNVSTDADIYAVCTMDITSFKAAFVAACEDAQAKTFKAAADSFKLGLAVNTTVTDSTDKAEDKNATAALYSTFAATVVDAEGKVLATIADAIQPKVEVADGKIAAKTYKATKRVLKEEYNMKGVSASYGNIEGGAEWYEQAAAYTDKMVGKTAADIKAIKTKESNGHNVADDADLFAVCTMDVTAFNADLVEAIEAAK